MKTIQKLEENGSMKDNFEKNVHFAWSIESLIGITSDQQNKKGNNLLKYMQTIPDYITDYGFIEA